MILSSRIRSIRRQRYVAMLITLVVLSAPAGLAAQGGTKCSADPNAVERVSDVTPIFADSQFAAFRARNGIDTLALGDTTAIVTDPQVCGHLTTATRAAFRTVFQTHVSLDSHQLYFFRIGKYYVVMAIPVAPNGFAMNGAAPIMIFRGNYDYLAHIFW